MKTSQIYVTAGVIVVLGIVGMLVLRNKTEPASEVASTQTNQTSESTNTNTEPMSDYDIKNKAH